MEKIVIKPTFAIFSTIFSIVSQWAGGRSAASDDERVVGVTTQRDGCPVLPLLQPAGRGVAGGSDGGTNVRGESNLGVKARVLCPNK